MSSIVFQSVARRSGRLAGLMRCAFCGILAALLFSASFSARAAEKSKTLQIYFVDVEGGQATLFVTPEGKSLLIDTGWPGFDGRDAGRIVAAAKLAGIAKIDFVLLTHYHVDHTGGVPQLTARIPVGTFIDHGENREPGDADTQRAWQAYQALLAKGNFKRIIAKPGDDLPVAGVQAKVISADGALIEKPVSGAGDANPACDAVPQPPADQTENVRSLGVLLTFGKLRILDLGDLTKDKERELVCPVNRLGRIDIYVVSHHGWSQSNSSVFLNSVAPRVAIMDNGAAKGGSPSSWDAIEKSPRLEDLWQLHYSNEGGAAHNVADSFIANSTGPDAGNYLKLTAFSDGSFDVYNPRTQATKHYAPKSGN
jgi:competence protein ComEC